MIPKLSKSSRMRSIALLTALTFVSVAFAQTYTATGIVCDSVGEPESFATIRAYLLPDTIKSASHAIAGEDGVFSVSLPNAGEYRISITSFGKVDFNKDLTVSNSTPTIDMGRIELGNISNTLQELTVTAQRPLVTREIDRIGYDVQADSESKPAQLDEMLRKVPLVSVDPDGTIKVKGSKNFKIYKNGRQNNSFTRNAKDLFKSIPASTIKRIEVITDPGAKEDAEGTSAILNIVTMGTTLVKGVMGTASLGYETTNEYPTPSVMFTTQIGKVAISAYGSYGLMSKRGNESRNESLTKYEESGNEIRTEGTSTGHGEMEFFGIDASYELDSKNLFNAEFSGYGWNMKSDSYNKNTMTDASGNLIYSYGNKSKMNPNRYFDLNGGVNYQHSTGKQGEMIILSYLISTTDQKQGCRSEYEDMTNMPVAYTGTINDFHLNFIEHTGQIDWTRPLNDYNKLDIGAKYINRTNHSVNNQEYIGLQKEFSDFTHRTQVVAAYADYRLNWKKFGARAGIRYEYSHLSAKYKDGSNPSFSSNLNDWVPNAAVSYNISDANSVKFSYSTRINRPGISQLNPAVIETPTSISSGNPNLGSSLNHNLNLNFNHFGNKLSFDLNASYSFSNNSIIRFQDLIENDITMSGYVNGGKNRNFNLSAWLQYSPWMKTMFMFNGSVGYSSISNPSLNIDAKGWSSDIYASVRQNLLWGLTLNAFLSYGVSSPELYIKYINRFAYTCSYGVNIEKSFLKEKRLSVRIAVANPFGKKEMISMSEPINMGYSGYSKSYRLHNTNKFIFSISYRFGSLMTMVKKTGKSIKNDDVVNRKN